MSREIKFRAWLPESPSSLLPAQMHYFDLFNHSDIAMIKHNYEEGVAIMQYTGLKDKNGVEIYEGDVVRGTQILPYNNGIRGYKPVVVAWDNNTDSDIGNDTTGFNIGQDVDWEVIGNIYENPELLTNKEVKEDNKRGEE